MNPRIQKRLVNSILERVAQKQANTPPIKKNLEKLQEILKPMLKHFSEMEKETKSLRKLLDSFNDYFDGIEIPDFSQGERQLLREIDEILDSLRSVRKPSLIDTHYDQLEDYTSQILGDIADILKRYDQVVSKALGGKQ